ncbi:MAG: bifunctional riboflavin kinase/FAD synthetase [Clostridia bacterium]
MNVLFDDDIKQKDKLNRGIGLGNFDGIHIGHRKLIDVLVHECRERDIVSMVYTFNNHPDKILEKQNVKLLTSNEMKLEILASLHLDSICLKTFDEDFANLEPEDFVRDILVGRYGMKVAVTGFNYRFGRLGRGDIPLLRNMGKTCGFEVICVPPVKAGEEIISSTAIREHIRNGEMQETSRMLGRPYSIRGKVEHGNRIGSEIGFPTANIIPVDDYAMPSNGVYFTRTTVDDVLFNSITNLGTKPTYGNDSRRIIETHIFDFNGWLYGKEIDVHFIKRVRDELKYENAEELKSQIVRDIISAVDYFNKEKS